MNTQKQKKTEKTNPPETSGGLVSKVGEIADTSQITDSIDDLLKEAESVIAKNKQKKNPPREEKDTCWC